MSAEQDMGMLRVDTDTYSLDVDMIHRVLASAYWSENIPRAVVERAIAGSLCFGGYLDGHGQVAFARMITDGATFAYLADVFVLPDYRGRGYAKALVAEVMAHPDVQGLRRIMLATRDAHRLYARFGFVPVAASDRLMEIHVPGIYRQPAGVSEVSA